METKQLSTLKRELTEADLCARVETLDLSDFVIERLKGKDIATLGALLDADIEYLEKIFHERPSIVGYIADAVHKKGGCLKNEYADLNISEDVALIPIEILDLSPRVKKRFRYSGLRVFGDLLSYTADELLRIRQFGEDSLKEVKDYLKLFGYTLKDDAPTIDEVRQKLKAEGAHLLEEIFSNKVYLVLYRNGIYTIEDLQNYGPDVINLYGMGELRRRELAETMTAYNLQFNINAKKIEIPTNNGETKENTPKAVVMPTEEVVAEAKRENDAIRARIEKKEALVAEYDRLLQERQELLAREQELDALIATKLKDMNDVKVGATHGRK